MKNWIEEKQHFLAGATDWGRQPATNEDLLKNYHFLECGISLEESEILAAMLLKYGGVEGARAIAEDFLQGAFSVDLTRGPVTPPAAVAHLGNRLGLDQPAWRAFLQKMLGFEPGRAGSPELYCFCASVGAEVGVELKLDDPEVATMLLAQHQKQWTEVQTKRLREQKERELAEKRQRLEALDAQRAALEAAIAADENDLAESKT